MQTQVNRPRLSRHVPSFRQGSEAHSLMLISQRGPMKPMAQSQRYDPSVLTHVEPCSHGDRQPKNTQWILKLLREYILLTQTIHTANTNYTYW